MAKKVRQVIKIDEELCTGCGLCVPACAEGAIQIIDGKARLVSERYCDGLGACLGECPVGAISFEERESEEFDETAVEAHLESIGRKPSAKPEPHKSESHQQMSGSGCPSARTMDFRSSISNEDAGIRLKSELGQWPVKLYLVNPSAPYFQDADLLIAADCTPFAYASLHPDFLKGRAVVIGCPKFDDNDIYLTKLTQIISQNNIKSITVLHMEVPCCFGMAVLAEKATAAAGKNIPIQTKIVTLRGEVE